MKRFFSLLLSLLLCLSLVSCWEEETSDEELSDFWSSDTPAPEESDESAHSAPAFFALPYLSSLTLDPISCADGVQRTLASLLYEPLFTLDDSFVPHGVLCTDYVYDPDTLTYFFTLHSEVCFSDGSVLTAADVAATYQRAQVSERYASRLAGIASISTTGKYSLKITLSAPNSALPALLDIPIVKKGTQDDLIPLGTGPFLFFSDAAGTSLHINTLWWQKAALPVDSITLVPVKDSDTAMHLFAANTIHFLLTDLASSNSTSILGDVSLCDVPTTAMQYLCFNTQESALAEADVRSAISRRIDRSKLVSVYLTGHASASSFPIAPSSALASMAHLTTISSNDYAEVFAAHGIGEKQKKELTVLVNEGNSFKQAIVGELCQQLSVNNVVFTPKALAWNDYLTALAEGQFDLCLCEVRLTADWNSTALIGTDGALNYGRFSDPELDELLCAFLAHENGETAREFCTRFAETAPIAPLVFRSEAVLSPLGLIDNMTPTASDPFHGFRFWQIHLAAQ